MDTKKKNRLYYNYKRHTRDMDTKKKNRLYYNYKTWIQRRRIDMDGYKDEDKLRLEAFRTECKETVESAKLSYLANLGSKLNEPGTTSKKYLKM